MNYEKRESLKAFAFLLKYIFILISIIPTIIIFMFLGLFEYFQQKESPEEVYEYE